MCARAPVVPLTGDSGAAQAPPMTHISAKRAHRHSMVGSGAREVSGGRFSAASRPGSGANDGVPAGR